MKTMSFDPVDGSCLVRDMTPEEEKIWHEYDGPIPKVLVIERDSE